MARKTKISMQELRELLPAAIHGLLVEKARWRSPRDTAAFSAFDELVTMGCDSMFLLSMLVVLAETPRTDTWKGLTGFDNPDLLRTALKRLGTCAGDVERILGGAIGQGFLQSAAERELPVTLRRTADVIRTVAETITPEKNFTKSTARAEIVAHVLARTGQPRDRLVAAILSPTFSCDERKQSQWRSDNSHFIFAALRTKDGKA